MQLLHLAFDTTIERATMMNHFVDWLSYSAQEITTSNDLHNFISLGAFSFR